MSNKRQNTGLALADDLVAEGKAFFTFEEAKRRLGLSRAATGNLLQRMRAVGLVDRVRHGHYVVRQLGVLGTSSVAEEIALAVGAAFAGIPHRMAYRTALDEHDLIVHPSRSIYVASTHRIRAKMLSGRPLRVVRESESMLDVGAIACGHSRVSNLERALLDAGRRPALVGGVAALAQAVGAASGDVDTEVLIDYAQSLGWGSAVRRIGSIADALDLPGLAGQLRPLKPLTADLDLEPGTHRSRAWRDSRWRIRWPQPIDEIRAIAQQ